MKKNCLTGIMVLLLWPALLMAGPQPYVPRPHDLHDKDRPSPATVRQVQRGSDNFRSMPRESGSAPERSPQRFQPQPYIPDATPSVPVRPVAPAPATVKPPSGVDTPAPATVKPPSGADAPVPAVAKPSGGAEAAPSAPTTRPGTSAPKPAPLAPPPAQTASAKAELNTVVNRILSAYETRDCAALLKLFHPQAYVLLRHPLGEQGSLGHQQLREAYCQDMANAPTLQLKNSMTEMQGAERGKVWGQLTAKAADRTMPVSFEADLMWEKGVWLITDAVIQYELP